MTEKDRKEIMAACDTVLACNGASVSDRKFYNDVLRLIYDNMDLEKENKRLTELLKAQEAVKPIIEHRLFICPVCKNSLFREQKYCHECGRPVKWE